MQGPSHLKPKVKTDMLSQSCSTEEAGAGLTTDYHNHDCVGLYYKAHYGKHWEPTKIMVLVVESSCWDVEAFGKHGIPTNLKFSSLRRDPVLNHVS